MVRPGPKFTETQREVMIADVARYDAMGYSQGSIAKELEISQGMVSNYLEVVRRSYKERVQRDHAELVGQKIAELRAAREELYQAWKLSGNDAQEHMVERALRKVEEDLGRKSESSAGRIVKDVRTEMKVIRESVIRRGRLPGHEYMKLIILTIEREAELLGLLDTSSKVNNVNVNRVVMGGENVDWAEFHRKVEKSARDDPVLKALEAVGQEVTTDVPVTSTKPVT